jgi:hypothetical protein
MPLLLPPGSFLQQSDAAPENSSTKHLLMMNNITFANSTSSTNSINSQDEELLPRSRGNNYTSDNDSHASTSSPLRQRGKVQLNEEPIVYLSPVLVTSSPLRQRGKVQLNEEPIVYLSFRVYLSPVLVTETSMPQPLNTATAAVPQPAVKKDGAVVLDDESYSISSGEQINATALEEPSKKNGEDNSMSPAYSSMSEESGSDSRSPEVVQRGTKRVMMRRQLRWQQDQLDGFRRGWQRGDCANTVSEMWR